jgi:hypothetical protein
MTTDRYQVIMTEFQDCGIVQPGANVYQRLEDTYCIFVQACLT